METAELPIQSHDHQLVLTTTPTTCISNQLLPPPPSSEGVTFNSHDDDSGAEVTQSQEHGDAESKLEQQGPKPNFHISNGDSNGGGPEESSLTTKTGNNEICDGDAPMFSISPPQSDYEISLTSWYSEPCDTTSRVLRSCCTGSCGRDKIQEHVHNAGNVHCSPIEQSEQTDRSDEKENTTPPPLVSSAEKNRKMRLDCSTTDNRSRRLDRKNEGQQRSRSVGNPGIHCVGKHNRKLSREDLLQPSLECPRCSRKSKSGSATPAVTPAIRNPKRTGLKSDQHTLTTTVTSKKCYRKPIKSILKPDFRGGSSGSEKQSSMDSLGSNHTSSGGCGSGGGGRGQRGGGTGHMTSSDLGPRLKTKFSTEIGLGPERPQWDENDFVGLKRIERYATLRIRRPLAKNSGSGPGPGGDPALEEGPRKLSFEDHHRQDGTELMTKSLSYVKTDSTQNDFVTSTTPFQRNGSLRGRSSSRQTAVVQPCATRTSVLRLQKMQEKKGIVPTALAQSSSGHSDSGDSLTAPVSASAQAQSAKHGGSSISKVFTKLSSAFGQTASSAQKRQRQERGIQTEPILILKKPEFTNGIGLGGIRNPISRSPTPMSPDNENGPSSVSPGSLDPGIEILRLRQELQKYKARVIKYEHIYNAAEQENVILGNHLREVEKESKEMINFLQDEKLMLAETLAEMEVERTVLMTKLEGQAKVVRKLEDKLSLGRSQVKEAHQDVASYTTDLASESLKTKTLQDEVALLRKRVEKLNEEQE